MNPKCQTRPGFDTFSAKSAHLTGLKMRRITRAASCVDGPRLARDHLVCSAEVACSHVSGLLVQSGWTAGPDGVREPSPHHSNGIDVPMNRQASLGCVGYVVAARHANITAAEHAALPTHAQWCTSRSSAPISLST